MTNSDILFHYQEELALQNGLFEIARTVLKYSIQATGASGGVFLYLPPRAQHFEVLAHEGDTEKGMRGWMSILPNSNHPLVKSIRDGEPLFKTDSESKKMIAALPIGEVNFCFLGFMMEFSKDTELDESVRAFLLTSMEIAKSAMEKILGEGV